MEATSAKNRNIEVVGNFTELRSNCQSGDGKQQQVPVIETRTKTQ